MTDKIFEFVDRWASKITAHVFVHKVERLLNFSTPTAEEIIAEEHESNSSLREAYRKNLEIALESVVESVKRLLGKVVVTSNHRELLGEHGICGHLFHYPLPRGALV